MDVDVETYDFLEHHGVMGMKWGRRKDRAPGVSSGTNREARKDAHEVARAKMFFGDGAGTRRKLINKAVEAKKARDPEYAKAFDHHLGLQDLSKHASEAKKERGSIDRKDRNKKRAGFFARKITGEMGTQAAFAAVAVGGVAYLNSPHGRSKMSQAARFVKDSQADFARKRGAAKINDWLRNVT